MDALSPTASDILRALASLPGLSEVGDVDDADESRFCIEGRLALDALSVKVQGQGTLGHPLAPEAAAALGAASTPARYGRREATLLDAQVRDSGEIDAQALTLDWRDDALSPLLSEVARGLGLHALEARPHKLLIYGPGQFFKPHQDTEKHAGMVGTLVLVWPSAHIGGELQVRHGDEEVRFASQHLRADAIRWCAFYADCQHEVLPVIEGWRVVLTLDLVVPAAPALLPGTPVHPPLREALRAHFFPAQTPLHSPWVLLLDHQYTEHGLYWSLLKGEDRPRVLALRAAAQALGLVVHLALVKIHESWTASTDDYRSRGRPGAPKPDELIDEDMAFDYWVDADDQPLQRTALPVAWSDVTSLRDTDDSFLVDEQYEGYMGNYGETLDYWYRRAALVIQTPMAAEVSRFATDFEAALADMLTLARHSDRAEDLAQRIDAVTTSLGRQREAQGRALLARYAELAMAVPDAAQARSLCEGFAWGEFSSADVPVWAGLQARWGVPWLLDAIGAWADAPVRWAYRSLHKGGDAYRLWWPQPLPAFVQACQNAKLDAAVIEQVLTRCCAALAASDHELASAPPVQRYAACKRRLRDVGDLLQALAFSPGAAAHVRAVLSHVRAHPALYPIEVLGPWWRTLLPVIAALPEMTALRAAVIDALQQALAAPEWAADDQRLGDVEWTCRCPDCQRVIDWAASPSAAPLTLAIAEARRQHVQGKLHNAAVVVAVKTVKQGSPHKLVLSKPTDLHAKRCARRQAWVDDLAALGGGTGEAL